VVLFLDALPSILPRLRRSFLPLWWTCCWLRGGLGIRVYRVVLVAVDLVLVAADLVMVTVWICHSGGVCRRGDVFAE
jgi:hypothetical protein